MDCRAFLHQFMYFSLNAKCDDIWRWDLWEITSLDEVQDGVLIMESVFL